MACVDLDPASDDDLEPIVVLDDDAPAPGLPPAAQDYLRSQGVTDPATWAAFRLDAVTAADLHRLLSARQRGHLGAGLWMPTCDPRQPATLSGLIRLTPAQNKHACIGTPGGIAGPVDLDQRSRVVLCDAPLTALRLHQAGVPDVAVVEDPAVLVPLADWLAPRQVVLVSHKRSGLAVLQAAVPTATGLLLPADPARVAPGIRAMLGLAEPVAAEAPPPITPLLLREIHDYARGRLTSGCAEAALRTVGAHLPDLVTAYHIGYLPADYRSALSRTAQRALAGRRLASTLVLPAYDAQGVLVDLLLVHALPGHGHVDGIHAEPLGLLAPELAQGSETLIVTDTVPWLCRSFAAGSRNVLLLRGLPDAIRNAERLVQAGVRVVSLQVRRQAAEIAQALRAAGITVQMLASGCVRTSHEAGVAAAPASELEPVQIPPSVSAVEAEPAPTSPVAALPDAPVAAAVDAGVATPVFIEEDRTAEVAIFQVGPMRFAIESRDDGGTRRQVVVRAHGQVAQDRCDLASPAQVQRFAGNAARRVGIPAEALVGHLAAVLAAQVAREEAQHRDPGVVISAADRALGAAFLDRPDLLGQVATDLTDLGWVGEDDAKVLLYLGSVSRLLPRPLWTVYRARSGAAPWAALGYIASLTPPEERVVCHRVTDALLRQADPRALRHRLLCIDQAETLRPEAALSLRILHERGGVGWATAGIAADLGSTGAVRRDARGPVAVLAAAAGDLDPRCREDFLTVPVDDSPAQTVRVLEQQRRSVDGARTPAAPAIIARHHAAQRLLERLSVVVPFAERIAFPASRLRHRAEQAWFLTLIQASALLHQRQRPRVGGAIAATEADFAIAARLTAGVLGEVGASLSPGAERLRQVITGHGLSTCTMADLAGLLPEWTRWTFRSALQDLCDFGYLTASPPKRGRGNLRIFTLVARPVATVAGIILRPADAPVLTTGMAKMAENGGGSSAIVSLGRTGT